MKRIVGTVILALSVVLCYSQSTWILNVGSNRINTQLLDSITYSINNDIPSCHYWFGGDIVDTQVLENNTLLSAQESDVYFEYATFEEDGYDAVITDDGYFAANYPIPETENFVFVFGNFNTQDDIYYIQSDKYGAIVAVKIGDVSYSTLYTEKGLCLVKENYENIVIPYECFSQASLSGVSKVHTDFMHSRMYNNLQIGNQLSSYMQHPQRTALQYMYRHFLEGRFNRYGALTADILDLLFDKSDKFTWVNLMNRFNEITYFGNASVRALPAIEKRLLEYTLPCEVSGLNLNPDFKQVLLSDGVNIETLLGFSYELEMSSWRDGAPRTEFQSQTHPISGNGVENFEFSFQELSSFYTYEPQIAVSVDVKVDCDREALRRVLMSTPYSSEFNWNLTEPYTIRKTCFFNGISNNLLTGSVSSAVVEARNIKTTEADVECSFSEVPEGAECYILVSAEGSDLSLSFSAEADNEKQTVKVSGLAPFTSYIASSYIVYHGRSYAGVETCSFTTQGPSGGVVKVKDGTITQNSATVVCNFENIEEGATCGIVVTGDNNFYQRISASSTEGNQDVVIQGLEPFTEYSCVGFVQFGGEHGSYYREQPEGISFVTEMPDITGTWNCTQLNYQSWTQSYVEETYTITLHGDGTVSTSEYENILSGSWSYGMSGKLTISIMDLATQTANHGVDWEFMADNPKDPQKFSGSVASWNWNSVIGYVRHDGSSCTMIR